MTARHMRHAEIVAGSRVSRSAVPPIRAEVAIAFTEDEVLALALAVDELGIDFCDAETPQGIDQLTPEARRAVNAILAAADDIEKSRWGGDEKGQEA